MICRNFGGQNLECHGAIELGVLREINFAHSARSNQRDDLVAAKMCAEGYSHYLAFLIKTISEAAVPCEITSLLSRDQLKENI